MDRLLVAAALVVVVGVVAFVVSRRRSDAPTQPTWTVPAMVDRADFVRPEAPWLVAVFSSATCAGCHDVVAAAEPLASDAVAFDEVELGGRRELHQRYSIEAVPMLLIVDTDGVVRDSYVGPVGATELWARVAELRA